MKNQNSWHELVESYLKYRRQLGFKLETQGLRLYSFARFAESEGAPILTVALAASWARDSENKERATWDARLETLRPFAKYIKRFDPRHEVPPGNLFGTRRRRSAPHIYTESEILLLLEATDHLPPCHELRGATCRTIFGLLISTGLRISEAINLTRSDFDAAAGLIFIRKAKFNKDRIVPLHPSVTLELQEYEKERDRIALRPESNHFFLFESDVPANQRAIIYALQLICRRLDLKPRGDHKHHRLQDFRHSFIVRSVVRANEGHVDPAKAVMSLSTYVGHTSVAYTYWYFTGTPELMSLAANKFSTYFEESRV